MGVLTLVYVLRREDKPDAMQLVSMMMSAGMVYLKFGKLLGYKARTHPRVHAPVCMRKRAFTPTRAGADRCEEGPDWSDRADIGQAHTQGAGRHQPT